MTRGTTRASSGRRVAINVGAGFVPGMNAVIIGAALAGGRLGWDVVGIRDGFDGLLYPERYPDGGLVPLGADLIETRGSGRRRSPGPVEPGRPVSCPHDQRRRYGRRSGHVRRGHEEAEGGRDRRTDLRRRGPWAEHSLQAPPEGSQCGVRAPFGRERHRRHAGLLRVQQHPQLHHRDARQGSAGGPDGPEDRRGGGPRSPGRMAGAAGRHRRGCRCGAASRDPLRSLVGGGAS